MNAVATARKPHRDTAGYVCELRNKLSGDHNIIVDAKNGGDWIGNPDDGRWICLCNKHSTCCQFSSLPDARRAMKDATIFCQDCRAISGN